MTAHIRLTQQWNGLPIIQNECAEITVEQSAHAFTISFAAKLAKTFACPGSPPGFTHGLWDYDVLEIFFARPNGSYLEIEIGPKGHWLIYEFSSYRKAIDKNPRLLTYAYTVKNLTWKGEFLVPEEWLKAPIMQCKVNFYQIRTTNKGKEYFAWR